MFFNNYEDGKNKLLERLEKNDSQCTIASFYKCAMSSQDIARLVAIIEKNTYLTTLDFGDCVLRPSDISKIALAMKSNLNIMDVKGVVPCQDDSSQVRNDISCIQVYVQRNVENLKKISF